MTYPADTEIPPIPVHLKGSDIPLNGAQPKRRRRALRTTTWTLTAANPVQLVLPYADTRCEAYITSAVSSGAGPAVTAPPVPATGVAAQNTNAFPVQVIIAANGATITAVAVNGITVGAAAGTYTVPAYGSISISYTVATPTWTWNSLATPVIYISTSQAGAQAAAGGSAQISGTDTMPFPVNTTDQVWASAAGGYPVTVSVVAIYDEAE